MIKKDTKISLSIMAIFFIIPGALIVNPAIQSIAQAYPEVPYTSILLLSTIPLLIVVPISLVSGAIAGTKIKYKSLLILSITLYVFGGAMPYVFRSFSAVMVSRIIYGIGVGIATPLPNGLAIRFFNGQRRANMMGLGSMVINIASTIFLLLSGVISTVNLNLIWLIHLVALVPLILLILFLDEPKKTEHIEQTKSKLPVGAVLLALFIAFVYMNVNPLLLNMSSILSAENIGNSAVAGTILAMYTVGGIAGGAIFGKAYKYLNRLTIPVSLLILSLGLGICNFAHSISFFIAGSIIAGIGFFMLFPAVLMAAGKITSVSSSSIVSAMILSGINLGGFLSSFYIGFISSVLKNTSPRLPILSGTMIIFFISFLWGAFALFKNKHS